MGTLSLNIKKLQLHEEDFEIVLIDLTVMALAATNILVCLSATTHYRARIYSEQDLLITYIKT